MHNGKVFANDDAFNEYKNLILRMYPYITRNTTKEELDGYIFSNIIPDYL